MPRYAGIDYGTRRIGLALSDYAGKIASPADVIRSSADIARDAATVADWARANDSTAIIVGLPLNMDGTDSDQTRLTRRFARHLEKSGLPVTLWDERLSSFAADELICHAEIRGSRKKNARDALAAAVTLQAFLDARHSDSEPAP